MSSSIVFAGHLPVFFFYYDLKHFLSCLWCWRAMSIVQWSVASCSTKQQLLDVWGHKMRVDIGLDSKKLGVFLVKLSKTPKHCKTIFVRPSSLKISLQPVVERRQPRVHTQTHPSARTRGSLRGQQAPRVFQVSLWGSCCWEGDVSSRGRTQRRKSDERVEALQESSHLCKLSRGWGCYSYLLRAHTKKKDPHIYSENCTAAIQNSISLVPLLCRSTDTSIVMRRAGPYISLAEPQYSQRGSGLFFKPLRSSVGWDRCMSWSTVWHLGMHCYATLPPSLLVYSPALAPFLWQQRELREEEQWLWRQGYRVLSTSEREETTSNKSELLWRMLPHSSLSFSFPVCLSAGVRATRQHIYHQQTWDPAL